MPSFAKLLALLLVAAAMAGGPAVRPALAADPSAAAFSSARTADENAWAERRVDGLVLRYKPHTADEANWYGAAAESAYRQVTEIFGVERRELSIVLFPDEESYVDANPLAARAEGVLGHARPSSNEVGLALNRLRDQSEALRRDTIRHELTHIVLAEMSDQRLPIGFQEGIAQYLEQDPEARERVVRGLRRAIDEDQLLGFNDLNRTRAFMSRPWFSYPQSYSVVAFLTERHGLGKVVDLVRATRDAETLDAASTRAFGAPLDALEQEWKASLPAFLDGGYARNQLDAWEMTEPRQKLAESRFAEARVGFEYAARLFEGLGRTERLDQARDGARRASLGVEGLELSHQGAAALGGFDYARATELLGQAESRWSSLGDESRRALTAAALEQARTGTVAEVGLIEARTLLEDWKFQDATDRALGAGQAFAALGDEARTEEANQLMADVRETQTRLATYAIGAGVAGLGAAGAGWLLGRRRRPAPVPLAAGAVGAGGREWSL